MLKKNSEYCSTVVKTMGKFFSRSYLQSCMSCNDLISDPLRHLLCFCQGKRGDVVKLWSCMIQTYGLVFFQRFISYRPERQVQTVLFDMLNEIMVVYMEHYAVASMLKLITTYSEIFALLLLHFGLLVFRVGK